MIRRLGVAALAATGLAFFELLAVLALEHRRVASIWEADVGLLWLTPTLVVFAALAGLLGALVDAALEVPGPAGRAVLGVVAAIAAGALGYGLGGGRHLASALARGGFALGLALAAAAVVALTHRPLVAFRAKQPLGFGLAVLAGIAGVELVNRLVLVRLYPPFHLALALVALAAAPVAALAFAGPSHAGGHERAWTLPLAFVVLVGLGVPASARKLSHFDNFRWTVLEAAPIGGRAVELAARVAPPPASDDAAPAAAGCPTCVPATTGKMSLDFRGRDILLVTIDALRADHVGAYGYGRPTSPRLDRLAAEGVCFDAAYTATPHTSYAITSLMTGKYMRPLLTQDMGVDSDTWAGLLRTYGYRTAAFYPPAVFFIDAPRFQTFKDRFLDFEYRWVEFAEGDQRVGQVERYLKDAPRDRPLFTWVHLFGPHEPYEAHADHLFGERDIDRYDSEVAEADATLGRIQDAFVAARPRALVLVTADHGEEFGDHGGRYHGTSVYEEQVRVPLVVWAPGLVKHGRVAEPVELIDLLPTVLTGLDIPRPPRLRGRDLGGLLAGSAGPGPGFAYADTDDQALLARGSLRLLCARRVGACQLFDLASDPREEHDVAGARATDRDKLRAELRDLGASHGKYELGGLRAEGKGWPAPIRRALAGDGDAAPEVAELLDDAAVDVRRKAAEVLFDLRSPGAAAALRLALGREEDTEAKAWEALALTRLGQGAPLVAELLDGPEPRFRRLAALALGEAGDKRGEGVLIDWWMHGEARDFERSRQILLVFAELKTKNALGPLVPSLGDVRLRPFIARALARIGDDAARGALLHALGDERLQSTRVALADALVDLGAREELAVPLRRFLGVPDPLPGGLGLALKAKILEHVGGPKARDLAKLGAHADLGQAVELIIPPGGNGHGIRVLVRATSHGASPGEVRVSSGTHLIRFDRDGTPRRQHGVPALDAERELRLVIPHSDQALEVSATVPPTLGLRPGLSTAVVVYASSGVTVEAIALLPLTDELPP
ncbi:MAG TPA: sulfatase-like hydrolase/transferase, partial [Polyangiaceae bacterium]|nr:sulfatase-like hydrolase/transferase [Polyangiaceae bacterium]